MAHVLVAPCTLSLFIQHVSLHVSLNVSFCRSSCHILLLLLYQFVVATHFGVGVQRRLPFPCFFLLFIVVLFVAVFLFYSCLLLFFLFIPVLCFLSIAVFLFYSCLLLFFLFQPVFLVSSCFSCLFLFYFPVLPTLT